MKINNCGARFSAIVSIGEKIKKLSEENNQEYLYLNRGVNDVCQINLEPVIKRIDFNSPSIQFYPPNSGMPALKEAINKEFFGNRTQNENITITAGSMGGLDLIFQTLDVINIYLPSYFWGPYGHISTIRKKENRTYDCFDELKKNLSSLHKSAVVICDPNNPLGNKYNDEALLNLMKVLNDNGTVVIFDSPYRRVFCDNSDRMYQHLMQLQDVIIVESFSKSVGLSGQRLGFIHSVNNEFNEEIRLRILYVCNGVNAAAQNIVYQLLTSEEGKNAVREFKERTTTDIRKNIEFMKSRGLLAEEFYKDTEPRGIFAIINKSEEELLRNRIGSVSLAFFTRTQKEKAAKYARICVSVPHEKFIRFLTPLAQE
ncbi:MAG: pyridoxal phosphate-dependent aminotransferase [Bacteroidales bacterium]|nr:MAG: pyridoxal phosphate-dependent aminotransferase [Bacteroidales bacterium]